MPGNASAAGKRELSEKELMELLSPKREVDLKIKGVFDGLPKKFCIMLVEKLSDYGIFNTRLVKYFTDKKIKGVYVTFNKNLSDIIEIFKADGIETSNIAFIDAITCLTEGKRLSGKNYYYLDSPRDVIELNIALKKAVNGLGRGEKFVIVDSLSTLLVYNKERVVEKLVHSFSGKMRAWEAHGVLILVGSAKKEITNTLSQFCDKVITV